MVEGTMKEDTQQMRIPSIHDIALLVDAVKSAEDGTMPIEHAYDFIKYHYDNHFMMADHYLEQLEYLRKEQGR